eukprot:CAMPEP_0194199368 /NCGR_PEP_ID=MMETSP0156-20130528/415_1 /TAXON_ID=33649 /ORGANISM="Thalassionema nitzschioides, Strain L26-B" /LENGTH=341 /DNA_ID=CAMNT_0038924253 /DNA_START=178 /DNA_END=1200 /DNA_ORIENTATION=-
MTITSFAFKGHKSSVNCLEYQKNGDSSLLLSGSDDKTARVWDIRTSKTALCIQALSAVTSASFGDPSTKGERGGLFSQNASVFLAMEDTTIFEYDLRRAETPILMQPTHDLTDSFQLTEEVNQISFSKGRISSADDGGAVRIWDGAKLRVLQSERSSPFLMTCCSFRSGDQLASGGTDCNIYLWDIGRPHKPLDTISITRDDTGANQVCNPPMVQTLAWSPSRRLLATGLGDGTISITTVVKKKLIELARLRNGHSDSVASLCFPKFGSPNSNDRLLASAGTDGLIFFWELNGTMAGKSSQEPSRVLSPELLRKEVEDIEFTSKEEYDLLFGIPHQAKANW